MEPVLEDTEEEEAAAAAESVKFNLGFDGKLLGNGMREYGLVM